MSILRAGEHSTRYCRNRLGLGHETIAGAPTADRRWRIGLPGLFAVSDPEGDEAAWLGRRRVGNGRIHLGRIRSRAPLDAAQTAAGANLGGPYLLTALRVEGVHLA